MTRHCPTTPVWIRQDNDTEGIMSNRNDARAVELLSETARELEALSFCWGPPDVCGFTRSDMHSLTGTIELKAVDGSLGLGARDKPASLSATQVEAMMPTVSRLGFESVQELWNWENAPDRTEDDVMHRLEQAVTGRSTTGTPEEPARNDAIHSDRS